MARMELYLFTAALLQNFTVELPPGKTFNTKIVESLGMRLPVEQEFIYKNRKPDVLSHYGSLKNCVYY